MCGYNYSCGISTVFCTGIETKIAMSEWIKETFTGSNDLFRYSLRSIRNWMEDEIGVYSSVTEFSYALEEFEFEKEGDFFYMKLSPEAGPVVINKIYPFSNISWDEDKKEKMRKRLLQQAAKISLDDLT